MGRFYGDVDIELWRFAFRGDNILVKPVEETMSLGGIILPAPDEVKQRQARVVAVGTGRVTKTYGVTVPPPVKVDDLIIHERFSKNEEKEIYEFKVCGIRYLLLQERNIQAILP